VIALDPVRLAGLEQYLEGLGHGCLQGAGAIADALAGTGEEAAGEQAELRRLAAWCAIHRDDVARRRRLVEELPAGLPQPAWRFTSRAEAVDRADRLVARLRRALDGEGADRDQLAALLDELRRGAASPTFAARVLTELGPDRAARLPVLIDARWAGQDAAEEVAALAVVRDALAAASHLRGRGALSEAWIRRFHGLPADGPDEEEGADPASAAAEQLLVGAGFALGFARIAARALRARRVGFALLAGDELVAIVRAGTDSEPATDPVAVGPRDALTVAQVVAHVRRLERTGLVLVAAQELLAIVEAEAGPDTDLGTRVGAALHAGSTIAFVAANAATPLGWAGLAGAGCLLAFAAFLASATAEGDPPPSEENLRRRRTPTHNPDTGETRYPSGSASNMHGDEAGNVLDPAYV